MLNNLNSVKMGWVRFRERLNKKYVSADINHIMPKIRIFRLYFCRKHYRLQLA